MTRFNDKMRENLSCENTIMKQDDDLLMEQILDNLNNTPLGNVLKRIASMPEIRQNKVLEVRQSLSSDQYELNERLDLAMEKVLEDLNA
jgi:hypothetical protein